MARCAMALCSGVSAVDGFLEVAARVRAFAHQIENAASRKGREAGVLRILHGLAIERECLFELALAHQLLALLEELRLL